MWCSHRPCLLLRSVQETCNFDALYAYLSTSNYDFAYDRAKNLCASLPPTQPPAHTHTPRRSHRLTRAFPLLSALRRPKRNIKTAMNNEIMLYGIAQKEQLGAHTPLAPSHVDTHTHTSGTHSPGTHVLRRL